MFDCQERRWCSPSLGWGEATAWTWTTRTTASCWWAGAGPRGRRKWGTPSLIPATWQSCSVAGSVMHWYEIWDVSDYLTIWGHNDSLEWEFYWISISIHHRPHCTSPLGVSCGEQTIVVVVVTLWQCDISNDRRWHDGRISSLTAQSGWSWHLNISGTRDWGLARPWAAPSVSLPVFISGDTLVLSIMCWVTTPLSHITGYHKP